MTPDAPVPSDERFFVVIHGPNYPRVMMEDEDRMALWATADEAREATKNHIAVRAFGAAIFELGAPEEEV